MVTGVTSVTGSCLYDVGSVYSRATDLLALWFARRLGAGSGWDDGRPRRLHLIREPQCVAQPGRVVRVFPQR